MICEKLKAAASSNFYPLLLSDLAPELNTKVVPNFIGNMLAKFEPKRISMQEIIANYRSSVFCETEKPEEE